MRVKTKEQLKKIIGGTLRTTPSGAEIQVGKGKVHLGAGFDLKNRSAGADITVGKHHKSVSIGGKKKK